MARNFLARGGHCRRAVVACARESHPLFDGAIRWHGPADVVCLAAPRASRRFVGPAYRHVCSGKIFEASDADIFVLTHSFVSGHTLKHLVAACALFAFLPARGERGRI